MNATNILNKKLQPLHYATIYDRIDADEIIDVLIDNGAEINSTDTDGNTPLIYACRAAAIDHDNVHQSRKRRENSLRITTRGRRPNQGREEIVKKCIEKGAGVKHGNKWKRSAIHAAAFYGNDRVIEILVANNADINAKDCYDNTPIHDASRGSLDKSVEEVMDEELSTETESETRSSQCQGHPNTISEILKFGGIVNRVNKWKSTSLKFAIHSKRPVCQNRFRSTNEEIDIERLLIDNGGTYSGKCFCDNGEASEFSVCPTDGSHSCEVCGAGYSNVTKSVPKPVKLINNTIDGESLIYDYSVSEVQYINVTFCVSDECICDNGEGVVGIDCSKKFDITCPQNCYFHTVYQPAKAGYESCVEYQVREMADVNARENGTSSIYQAVRESHPNIVSILFNNNATIDGTTDDDCESCTEPGDSLLSEA